MIATVLAGDNGSPADLIADFTFNLRVVGCSASSFEFSTPIDNAEYILGAPALTLSPNPLPFCYTGIPIQYSATFS